ncbi:MAG: tetratricopeptide repeat protein [Planctomycetes bacterium]|nr:tetratricopeptide repeat protein [Planctomycetota bacterium]
MVALADGALDAAGRAVALARFEARVAACGSDEEALHLALDGPEAQRLAAELGRDPGWTDGVFARERALLVATRDGRRAGEVAPSLRALGREDLAARLEAAVADQAGDAHRVLERLEVAVDAAAPAARAAALLERGEAHFNARRYSEAEVDLTRVVELDPLATRAWRHRRLARTRLGRPGEAADDARREVALRGESDAWASGLVFVPADLLEAAGDLEAARAALLALRARRGTAGGERRLGHVLRLLGDEEGSRAAFRRVLSERPPGLLSDYLQAAAGLEAPGEMAPDGVGPYLELLRATAAPDEQVQAAVTLVALGHADAAEALATDALAAGGEPAQALVARARARERLGRLDEALEDWDRLITHHLAAAGPSMPARGEATTGAGRVILSSPHRQRSAALLERAQLRARLGLLVGALQDAREALRLLPPDHHLAPELRALAAAWERDLQVLDVVRQATDAALDGDARGALRALGAVRAGRPGANPRVALAVTGALRLVARVGGEGVASAQVLDGAAAALDAAAHQGAAQEVVRDLRRRLEEDLRAVRAVDAADPEERARALLALGRHAAAGAALGALQAQDSAAARTLDQARCLRAAGDLAGARAVYSRVAEGAPGESAALARVGLAALANDAGDGATALRWLEDLPPGAWAADGALERGRALLALGRLADALEALDQAPDEGGVRSARCARACSKRSAGGPRRAAPCSWRCGPRPRSTTTTTTCDCGAPCAARRSRRSPTTSRSSAWRIARIRRPASNPQARQHRLERRLDRVWRRAAGLERRLGVLEPAARA